MHRLLVFVLLVAVACGLKAVPYGYSWSAETLFSSQTISTTTSTIPDSTYYDFSQHYETAQDSSPFEIIDEDNDETSPDSDSEPSLRKPFDMDEHLHNKDGDDWGLYFPIEVTEESTTVHQTMGFGLRKRGAAMGTVQMDCLDASEVCKNAGWFQNCLHDARGDPTTVTYENCPLELGIVKPVAEENRVQSGVTTS
jgi:hypothetical protein